MNTDSLIEKIAQESHRVTAEFYSRPFDNALDVHKHIAKAAIAAMGEASTRKDEEVGKPTSSTSPAKVCSLCDTSGRCTHACEESSEISYNNMQPGEFLQAVGMDGKLWTDAFMEMWGNRLSEVDHGLMLGWFCNAIMAGYDEAQRRANKPVSVSLETCARAIDPNAFEYEGKDVEHEGDKARRASARRKAKAVLGAAGVKYVD